MYMCTCTCTIWALWILHVQWDYTWATHTCSNIHAHTCMHIHAHTHTYACKHTHTHMRIHTCACVHTHTHTHTPLPQQVLTRLYVRFYRCFLGPQYGAKREVWTVWLRSLHAGLTHHHITQSRCSLASFPDSPVNTILTFELAPTILCMESLRRRLDTGAHNNQTFWMIMSE